jgi:hypothetical protein
MLERILRLRGGSTLEFGDEDMRAEAQAHADRIKQALDLLRRFL